MATEPTAGDARPRRRVALEVAVVLTALWLPPAFWSVLYGLEPELATGASFVVDALQVAVSSLAVLALVGWVIARSGWSPRVFGIVRLRWQDAVAGFVLWALMQGVWLVWPIGMPSEGSPASFPAPSAPWHWPLLVGAFALLSVAEELLYRAYLVKRLSRVLGDGGSAVLASAVLFAVIHLYQGTSAAGFTFVLGVVFGVVMLVWRSLWPLAIAHLLQDVWAYLPAGPPA